MRSVIENEIFDAERALYESRGVLVRACKFEGPLDGESALKESSDVLVSDTLFDLRYPLWHDTDILVENCTFTQNCRAPLWYSQKIAIKGSKIHGTKALRECSFVEIEKCDVISDEFGWSVNDVKIQDSSFSGQYFMLRADRLDFKNVSLHGKYSFQYIKDSTFDECEFDTKDAFWHAENVTVSNSVISGEYLAWYSKNLTFINCKITGTQPFCYAEGLKLINCEMHGADLAFERSTVDADITTPLISIKNPKSGTIRVQSVRELIDIKESSCKIVVANRFEKKV